MYRLTYHAFISVVLTTLALMISACALPGTQLKNDIKLAPILNLSIPQHINTLSEVIDSEQIKKKYSYVALLPDKKSFEFHVFGSKIIEEDTPRIDVSLVLANDETSAIDFFKGATCMRKPYLAGEGNIDGVYYHYCVPYLTPYYKITDSPIQEYNRWQYYGLIIQKGNLLITVNEKAVEPDRTLINSLIGEIADMIKFQLAKN